MNLNPFNVGAVFMAGIVWVLMLLYWIPVCVHVFNVVDRALASF